MPSQRPKPEVPSYFWQRLEEAVPPRKLRPHMHRSISTPDFSRLQFPRIQPQRRIRRVKSVTRVAAVPDVKRPVTKSNEWYACVAHPSARAQARIYDESWGTQGPVVDRFESPALA
jgi:hypothetical protein